MNLRCLLGFHAPVGWATKPGVFGAGRCARCHQAVGGVVLEGRPVVRYAASDREKVAIVTPAPVPVALPRTRIWWLRAVYVKGA
jgi:hypothetical protein